MEDTFVKTELDEIIAIILNYISEMKKTGFDRLEDDLIRVKILINSLLINRLNDKDYELDLY